MTAENGVGYVGAYDAGRFLPKGVESSKSRGRLRFSWRKALVVGSLVALATISALLLVN